MNCTGKIQNISKDWQTGQFLITFAINESSVINEIESLKDLEMLNIEAKKYRAKRSLDANAYAWVLFTKIAEVVRSSKDEIYENMLQKYGYLYKDDDGHVTVTVRADVDMSRVQGHWKFYKSNGKFSSYLMIKGSSEYDTAEMARFIDSVVLEAQELGIETATPDKIERMKALWNSGKT